MFEAIIDQPSILINTVFAIFAVAAALFLFLSVWIAWLSITYKPNPKEPPPLPPYHEKERRLLTKLEKARRAHKRIKEIERQLHDHRFGGQR